MTTTTRQSGKPAHQLEEQSLHLGTHRLSFKRILAATDLSKESLTHLILAARMAKQSHARLYVLYSVLPELSYADGIAGLTPELDRMNVEHARKRLDEYVSGVPLLRTIKYEDIVMYGEPGSAIQETVQAKKIDLVVVGSHGRSGLNKLAVGSVAESVIRSMHSPVLVAGPRCSKVQRPLRSVLFASDLHVDSLRAAQYAASIAQDRNATLISAHVISLDDLTEPRDRMPAKQYAIRQLRQLVPVDAEERCRLQFEVEIGDVAKEILKMATDKKVDLIVLGARPSAAMADHAPWAKISQIIRDAACPVLVVPARAA